MTNGRRGLARSTLALLIVIGLCATGVAAPAAAAGSSRVASSGTASRAATLTCADAVASVDAAANAVAEAQQKVKKLAKEVKRLDKKVKKLTKEVKRFKKAGKKAAKKAAKKARKSAAGLKKLRGKLNKTKAQLSSAQAAHAGAQSRVSGACAPVPPVPSMTPEPVTGLSAHPETPSAVTLTWILPTSGATLAGTTIRRATGVQAPTSGSEGVLVANPGTGVSTYVDDTVTASTTYTYAVFTRTAAGVTSTPVTVETTTPGPPDLTGPGAITDLDTTTTPSTVAFIWTPPTDSDLAAVEIRRTLGEDPPGDGGGEIVTTAPAVAAEFTDTGLIGGTTYSYSFITIDAAGNRGVALSTAVVLPDEAGTAAGVVALPGTVQPSPSLLQSATDNPDGTRTLFIGFAPEADAAASRRAKTSTAIEGDTASWQVGGRRVSATLLAGLDQCAVFGFYSTSSDLRRGATVVRPNRNAPKGVMTRVANATPAVSGLGCLVTGPHATIDQTYKKFDDSWAISAEKIGPKYDGDVEPFADKQKLPFGCTSDNDVKFTATADFSDLSGFAKISWNGVSQPSVEFTLTAAPEFTLSGTASGSFECEQEPQRGLAIPLGSTPFILELTPQASFNIQGSATIELGFRPKLTLSTVAAKNTLSVPPPTIDTSAEANLEAKLYLNASLTLGGTVGLEGEIGPRLQAPLEAPFCGDLSLHAALSLKAEVWFLGKWSHALASGDLATGQIGDCSKPDPPICRVQTDIPTAECAALVDIVTANSGRWNRADWATTTTPCSWIGVACEAGRVNQLEVYATGLGTVPSSISNLPHLRALVLGGNYLLKTLPETLGDLAELDYLDLSGTGLVALPESIGRLVKLEQLSLRDIPDLAYLPESLGDLTNLVFLSMRGSYGRASVPSSMKNLTDLRYLDLSYNNTYVTSVPSWIEDLTNLTTLYLGSNRIATVPTWIGDLANLRQLDLGFTDVAGDISAWAKPLSLTATQMERLFLTNYRCKNTGDDAELEAWLNVKAPNWTGNCW